MNADIAAASSDDLSRLHSPLSTPIGWDEGQIVALQARATWGNNSAPTAALNRAIYQRLTA